MSRASRNLKKFDREPWWTTQVRKRIGTDMLMMGVDNSVWLYRAVPQGPVVDAVSGGKMLQVGEPIDDAIDLVSRTMARSRTKRRALERGSYREGHLLAINVPRLFSAPDIENRDYINHLYPDRLRQDRLLMLGFKLRPTTGGGQGGFRRALDSVVHTLVEGGVQIGDYDRDRRAIGEAMSRAGLLVPTTTQLKLANSWWNNGNHADIPYMPHGDHLHMFNSDNAARAVEKLEADPDFSSCAEWPMVIGEHTLSFSTAEHIDIPYLDAVDPRAHWGSVLLDRGAVAVSIRFKIEPATITREELRRHRKNYLDDINERLSQGKMERAEQDEMLGALQDVESYYSGDGAPPTLVDTAITVVTTGRHETHGYDPTSIGEDAGLSLDLMLHRQELAFVDTMMCSPLRANPHQHDIPSTTLAQAGLGDMSRAGDKPRKSGAVALLGFSERDQQPMWMDAMAATDEDSLPVALMVGQSGSGKSVLMQWLADQYSRTHNDHGENTPVIMIDLKELSDFSSTVELTGGTSYALSDLVNDGANDGVFDAIRFSITPQAGVDRAHSLLMQVNPFGSMRVDYETPLRQALSYGVDHGANCTGQALQIAAEANGGKGVNPEAGEILMRVEQAATSAIFRAICGFNPSSTGLRAAGGTTYIRIGSMSLDLPNPGSHPDDQTQTQRTWLALVKAMVYGSISALANRQGVVLFDEGWIFLGSGRAEMESMGRLARSQQVFPVIFTQRTQDALRAELEGYISRGVILPIEDEKEARAALRLFKLEETPERLARITARATRGDTDGAPNHDSFRALRDPVTKEVIRGTIGMYVDLAGNAVPTEIALSPQFLRAASTNRGDIAARTTEARDVTAAPSASPQQGGPELSSGSDFDVW